MAKKNLNGWLWRQKAQPQTDALFSATGFQKWRQIMTRKKYGARVNLEHIKWRYMWNDDPHSKCYGDVIGLKTEENAEGKLQLLAQIDPTDDLIKLNKDRQKIYTSIECDPNFADTGEAYLVGLAVTDNPASLGTEMLVFSAGASANPLNNRKEKKPITFSLQPLKLNWNLWKKHKASLKKSKACLRKKRKIRR